LQRHTVVVLAFTSLQIGTKMSLTLSTTDDNKNSPAFLIALSPHPKGVAPLAWSFN
jgi:hypothetical protein